MRKKILFALNNMNVGGTEKAFLNLVETLSPEEYEITLYLLEKNGGFLPFVPSWVHIKTMDGYLDGIKSEIMDPPLQVATKHIASGRIYRGLALALTHLWFKLTGNRTAYYKCILKGKAEPVLYDKAIAFAGPFDFISVFVAYFVQAKERIQWIHFDVSKFQFNVKTCRRLYRSFDKIYCVSEAAKDSLLCKLPDIRQKTFVKPNIVSAELCRKMAEEPAEILRQGKEIILMTLGRLSSEKGQDIIPEVAQKMKQKGIRFCWYLIGDGILRDEIEHQVFALGLVNDIVLLGTKTNPYPFLKQADLYVQTSIHEGFCITLAEAKAFNLPIISTDCAGAHEQLDNIARCHVVERKTEELLNAILEEIHHANSINYCSGV